MSRWRWLSAACGAGRPAGLQRPRVVISTLRPMSTDTANAVKSAETIHRPRGYPFQLRAAAILERYEIITKDLTPFEKAYKAFADQLRIERSKYSIEEVQQLMAESKSKQERTEDAVRSQSPTSFWAQQQDKDKFVPASRVTEADMTNDRHSTNRRLQDVLYLVVKTKGGDWHFPVATHTGSANLREMAMCSVSDAVDAEGNMVVSFLSNHPVGVMAVAVAPPAENGLVGSKIFFFKAHWLKGPVTLGSQYEDYAWVTVGELRDYVAPNYYNVVKDMLRE